ncbi:MAG: hypothetical protein KF830_04585 [Planctomycetes bacterium]|nr:hypothetical protein [Planctomycetota bacterium]
MQSLLAPSAALGLLASSLSAQFCSDNLYRLYLVDSQGVQAPFVNGAYQFPTDAVYLAFDPSLPSGTYYVHVTDTPIDGFDQVLSTNSPLDRFVSVTNNAGVITLSLPFTDGSTPPVFGLGLGGVGQSILIAPFAASPFGDPCTFKAWYGNCWDLSNGPGNPYLLSGGVHPVTGQCCVRSYENFAVGGEPGNDVCGSVFLDANGNGQRDPGEAGAAGITVMLGDIPGSPTRVTDGNGNYCFTGVAPGSYLVMLVLDGTGFVATTAAQFAVVVSGCNSANVPDFGIRAPVGNCDGHTPGYWRNKHGKAKVLAYNILPTLSALRLVNASGQYVNLTTINAWATFLQEGNAVNMAYQLSRQLAAMHCNVIVGFVDGDCLVDAGSLGYLSISALMAQAVASLDAHPYTPAGHPQRSYQEALKNALDAANNNLNWL